MSCEVLIYEVHLNAKNNDKVLSTQTYLYCLPLISYFTCLACVLSHRIVGRIKQKHVDHLIWCLQTQTLLPTPKIKRLVLEF